MYMMQTAISLASVSSISSVPTCVLAGSVWQREQSEREQPARPGKRLVHPAKVNTHTKHLVCAGPQGALLCLAAATVGLGEPSEAYLRQIVPPVLASFTDQDSRVRYYACEALYNIAKVRAAVGEQQRPAGWYSCSVWATLAPASTYGRSRATAQWWIDSMPS
jgi:hypothetical protein